MGDAMKTIYNINVGSKKFNEIDGSLWVEHHCLIAEEGLKPGDYLCLCEVKTKVTELGFLKERTGRKLLCNIISVEKLSVDELSKTRLIQTDKPHYRVIFSLRDTLGNLYVF